jgi:hypothetical protein
MHKKLGNELQELLMANALPGMVDLDLLLLHFLPFCQCWHVSVHYDFEVRAGGLGLLGISET